MWRRLATWFRRRKYRPGVTITRFLAPDIRRDVEILDTSELEQGYVRARIRTWNVLHVHHGLAAAPEPGAARRVAIRELGKWTGEPWGGPVPDDDLSKIG
jgi:hypothetical protein